jgi:hypothetical protein
MQISPLVPLVGLFVIVANIIVAAVRPSFPPTVMGVQLFIGGMTTLTISVAHLIVPVGIEEFEQVLLFVTGCINCALGYYMVLLEIQKRGA